MTNPQCGGNATARRALFAPDGTEDLPNRSSAVALKLALIAMFALSMGTLAVAASFVGA
ncbi:MAG: hypothetical protein ABL879_00890 [Devosia sp.]